MSGFIGFVGVAGLVGSIILAIMDPRSAVASLTTGISSCVVCFLIVRILGIMYDIRDTLHEIKNNTKNVEPKTTSTYPSTQIHAFVTARAKNRLVLQILRTIELHNSFVLQKLRKRQITKSGDHSPLLWKCGYI